MAFYIAVKIGNALSYAEDEDGNTACLATEDLALRHAQLWLEVVEAENVRWTRALSASWNDENGSACSLRVVEL